MFNFILTHSAETGLILFFLCFAAIAVFAATRTAKQLDGWARLPLATHDLDDANGKEAP